MKLTTLLLLSALFSNPSFAVTSPFKVLKIINFELNHAKTHFWEKENIKFKEGSVLLVEAKDKEFFKLGQAHNRLLMVENRVLEMLNSGVLGKYRVFISPVVVDRRSRIVAVETKVLAESLVLNKRTAMAISPSNKSQRTSPLSPIELSKVNPTSIRLDREKYLYKLAAQTLLSVAPEAEAFVAHYLY